MAETPYSYNYDPRQVCWPATGRGCDNNLRAVGNDLSQLLKAETAGQEVRSVASQLKARFPVYRARLASFSSSEINEALVRQLHRCVVEPVDNVVLVGGPGTGKTRIATSLGVQSAPDRRIPIGIWHLALSRRRRTVAVDDRPASCVCSCGATPAITRRPRTYRRSSTPAGVTSR